MPESAGPPARRSRRRIDGVLLLDKPRGISSNAALQRVKRAFRAEKAGHTGTLDPLAEGLLPICLGEATKFSAALLDAGKGYFAVVHLGVTTETGDAEGAILRERPLAFGLERIEAALAAFRGPQMQVPHRYSAIKRQGRALFAYARAGESVELAPRPVTIDRLVVAGWAPPLLSIEVRCSKGTYIRTLAEDIGEALGCGAHVARLRRTAVAGFDVADAVDLAAIEALPDDAARDALLLPLTVLLEGLTRVDVAEADAARFRHGRAIEAPAAQWADGQLVAVHVREGGFLGLARLAAIGTGRVLAPARLLSAGDSRPADAGPGGKALLD